MSAFSDLLAELDHRWLERYGTTPRVTWSHRDGQWTCQAAQPTGTSDNWRHVFRGASGEQALRLLLDRLRGLA